VGFNMSWVFVDEINEDALYDALDLAATGVTPDEHDLGTSHVPLAGAALKSEWCAVFAHYALVMDATVGTTPPRLMRMPARSRCITCVILEHAMVSYASLWQEGRYVGKFDMTPIKDADIWRFAEICLLNSETFAASQWTSSEPKTHAVNPANGAWTISSMCRLTRQPRSPGTATVQLRRTSSETCRALYQPGGMS
jgi:hypothetical protein